MSSYTEVVFFEDFHEGFHRLPKDKFAGKINILEQPKNDWDGNLDNEPENYIAHRGRFVELSDPLHVYHGSFNYIDWHVFCDQVKLHKWENRDPSYFVVKYEFDPRIRWHVFSIEDTLTDPWKSRPELKFLA